jgi:hypothetical protein
MEGILANDFSMIKFDDWKKVIFFNELAISLIILEETPHIFEYNPHCTIVN